MPFFFEPPKCQFRGCFNHYYSPSNTFHCRVFLPAVILLVSLIGLTIGCGLFYRDNLSIIPLEQTVICNTTQWTIIPMSSNPSIAQLNVTVQIADHRPSRFCQWSDVRYFDCEIDDVYCILAAKNQVVNAEWPCVVRMIDTYTVDCSFLPTLHPIDTLTPSRILTGWIICLIFLWILCSVGLWFTQCNRGSDVPSMQPLLPSHICVTNSPQHELMA